MPLLIALLFLQVSQSALAADIPHPKKPSCNSNETCQEQASKLFGEILNDADEVLLAGNSRGSGYLCFRLSRVVSRYFELKNVDFNKLPLANADKQRVFDSLYQLGQINVPSQEYCDKRSSLSQLTPFVKNAVNDVKAALNILKPQQTSSGEHSKTAPP